jgi:hypothetical protein
MQTLARSFEDYLVATWHRGPSPERREAIHALAAAQGETYAHLFRRLEEKAADGKEPARGLAGAGAELEIRKGS